MNETIVAIWNKTVSPDDRVIVVGDLSAGLMGRYDEFRTILGRLNGHKILVRGNHDHQPDDWYISAGFESVTDWLLEEGILFIHKPATQFNTDTLKICENLDYKKIVHGHIHDRRPDLLCHFNVAWDRHYRLININEVKDGSEKEDNMG